MKAQHAPGFGRAGEARQTEPPAPVHTASTKKKRTSGVITQTINAMQSNVITMLPGPANKLARSQPNPPARADGGGRGSIRSCRRNVQSSVALIAQRSAIAVVRP